MPSPSGLQRRPKKLNSSSNDERLPLHHNRNDDGLGRRPRPQHSVKGTVCCVVLVLVITVVGYWWWWIETGIDDISEDGSTDPQHHRHHHHHRLVPEIHPDLAILRRHYPYSKDWYTPRILPPEKIRFEDWDKGPFIHIVHTRFMQEQGNLTALGHARLGLFRVFCLPTLVAQTAGANFLWIIKTDPELDPEIMQKLVDWLTPFPHFYLVGSNVNFRINEDFPGGWRGGAQAQDLSLSKIYTGNQTVLEHAMALQEELPVLETRLDADDGLHVEYLNQIQQQAMKEVFVNRDIKWMYWCSQRNVDWHWIDEPVEDPHFNKELAQMMGEYGAIGPVQHSNLCVTPGITTGFPVGTEEAAVPVFGHQELVSELRKLPSNRNCGVKHSKDCLRFVGEHAFEAIRSRAATSAGMLKISVADAIPITTHALAYALWDLAYKNFAIQRHQVRWMNQYLTDHVLDIARDNLAGQCTSGHSCKDSARKHLEGIIKYYEDRQQKHINSKTA